MDDFETVMDSLGTYATLCVAVRIAEYLRQILQVYFASIVSVYVTCFLFYSDYLLLSGRDSFVRAIDILSFFS